MKRFALLGLIVLLVAMATPQPPAVGALQSPLATQAPPLTSPIASPSPPGDSTPIPSAISPLLWILAGMILGGAIILAVQRTSPADDR